MDVCRITMMVSDLWKSELGTSDLGIGGRGMGFRVPNREMEFVHLNLQEGLISKFAVCEVVVVHVS